jgi:hypothetical protein
VRDYLPDPESLALAPGHREDNHEEEKELRPLMESAPISRIDGLEITQVTFLAEGDH